MWLAIGRSDVTPDRGTRSEPRRLCLEHPPPGHLAALQPHRRVVRLALRHRRGGQRLQRAGFTGSRRFFGLPTQLLQNDEVRQVQPSRGAAEGRYRGIRLAALEKADGIAAAQLAPLAVRLELITATAVEAFGNQWEGHRCRRYPWP